MAAPKSIDELPPLPVIDGVEIRHVPGFVGYAVGDNGDFWSCATSSNQGWKCGLWKKIRPYTMGKYGHLGVKIGGKTVAVARAILMAFVGPPPEGMQAAHYPDRNPRNNNLWNLQWKTAYDNHQDKELHGTVMRGELHGNARLTEEDVREIRRMKAEGATQKQITDRVRNHSLDGSRYCCPQEMEARCLRTPRAAARDDGPELTDTHEQAREPLMIVSAKRPAPLQWGN